MARYLGDHQFKKDRKKAVWDYNHEDAYVQGVLAYADTLRAMLSPDGGTMFINFNGHPADAIRPAAMKPNGFGLTAFAVLEIPASER